MDQEGGSLGGPILVPVDFSAHSRAALLWALEAAPRFEASVVVLHVVHDPGEASGYYRRVTPEGHLLSLEDAAREQMDAFLKAISEAQTLPSALETQLVSGVPPTRILEVAAEIGAGLIVMGSRGRTGLRHLLLGSKAERVVQLSPIPVTVVKEAAIDPEEDG